MFLGYIKDIETCRCGENINNLEMVEGNDNFELLECPKCKRHYVLVKNYYLGGEFDMLYIGNWVDVLEEVIR